MKEPGLAQGVLVSDAQNFEKVEAAMSISFQERKPDLFTSLNLTQKKVLAHLI